MMPEGVLAENEKSTAPWQTNQGFQRSELGQDELH
jgi:hypothetical protein